MQLAIKVAKHFLSPCLSDTERTEVTGTTSARSQGGYIKFEGKTSSHCWDIVSLPVFCVSSQVANELNSCLLTLGHFAKYV